LFLTIKFLCNQMIIKIDTHKSDLIKSKEKKYYAKLHKKNTY
jgi:hypothetical protein